MLLDLPPPTAKYRQSVHPERCVEFFCPVPVLQWEPDARPTMVHAVQRNRGGLGTAPVAAAAAAPAGPTSALFDGCSICCSAASMDCRHRSFVPKKLPPRLLVGSYARRGAQRFDALQYARSHNAMHCSGWCELVRRPSYEATRPTTNCSVVQLLLILLFF